MEIGDEIRVEIRDEISKNTNYKKGFVFCFVLFVAKK